MLTLSFPRRSLICAGVFLFVITFVQHCFAEKVIQPLTDTREFDAFTLENGLKVLIISDDTTDKSAASMDVWVGSGDDPEDRQGLAHFLEHMLFLGTEKYPKAGEYQDFISGNGGEHNAYTSLAHTNYFFDIDNRHFEAALDRFAQFFIAPLFNEKYVERERNAVHSEFSSKIKDDYRRAQEAFSEQVIPQHPLSHFSVGNLDTLTIDKPRPLRNDLLAFYEQYYSADRMALVIVSNKPVADIRAVVNKQFSAVPKRKVKDFVRTQKVFPDNFLPARLSVVPVRDQRSVSFSFPVPDSTAEYAKKPLSYIGFFIGHEGQGSLLSALKSVDWATGLSAGVGQSWRGGEMFSVSVTLTEKGIEHVEDIRSLLFDYINLLKTKGVEEWRFKEISLVEKARFNYGDKIDPIRQASYLANYMHEYPAKDLLQVNYLYETFDPKLIRTYLSYLREDNLFEQLLAPDIKTNKLSHYYKTPYKIQPLAQLAKVDEKKSEMASLVAKLMLPKKNAFIAKDFSIVGLSKDAKEKSLPVKIKSSDKADVWYVNDDYYDLPKGLLNVRYKLPEIEPSPKNAAVANVFADVLREALNEISYNANMGGLGYSITATARGIDFGFGGFDDSLDELVKVVFKTVEKYQKNKKYRASVNAENFERVKTELIRSQQNVRHSIPYRQVLREIPNFMYAPYWSVDDMTAAYQDLSLSEYEKLVDTMFDHASATVFVFGNYTEKEAGKLAKSLVQLLPKKGETIKTLGGVVNLSTSTKQFWRNYPVDHNDNVTSIYIQGQNDSVQEQARMQLISHMLAAPFYSYLRTEKQLGYIVFSSDYPIRRVPGILLMIQSPTQDSFQLKQEIESYLKKAPENVFANFERDRAALAAKLREGPKNQKDLREELWSSILKEDTHFDENERIAKEVEKLTLDDIKEVYAALFASNHSKLIITTESEGVPAPADLVPLKDYKSFKNEMPKYQYP